MSNKVTKSGWNPFHYDKHQQNSIDDWSRPLPVQNWTTTRELAAHDANWCQCQVRELIKPEIIFSFQTQNSKAYRT